jgi:hypothetical protein
VYSGESATTPWAASLARTASDNEPGCAGRMLDAWYIARPPATARCQGWSPECRGSRLPGELASPVWRRRSEIPCSPLPSHLSALPPCAGIAQHICHPSPSISHGIRIANLQDRSRVAVEAPPTCAECHQIRGPIRCEQIDAALDKTTHIPLSSIETSTRIVDLTVRRR